MIAKPVTPLERAAVALAILALAVGILTPLIGRVDSGLRLAVIGGRVIVMEVNRYGLAAESGFSVGMIAVALNGRELIRLPTYIYPDAEATPDPLTGEVPEPRPIGIEPAVPTPVLTDRTQLDALVASPLSGIAAVHDVDLAHWNVNESGGAELYTVGWWDRLRGSTLTVILGLLALFIAAWWLGTGRAGRSLRELTYPVALAVSGAFLFWPLATTSSYAGLALFSVLMPASMLPLAAALAQGIQSVEERRLAIAGSAACFAGAVAIGVLRLAGPAGEDQALPIAVLAGGITALPGIIAAGPRGSGTRLVVPTGANHSVASGRLLRSAELAVVGVSPFFAVISAIGPFGFVFPGWVLAVMIAGRITVRPLARLATRAQLQRDLVVAATEAERARVAADIHDDALQELTLLVRRLDESGDTEGAEIARTVSDRLRAICGDLRLPILDDLGVGPALDWLVLRIERLAGGEVRLERADAARPPADVELAFFRIAQEALANAVKHGKPPIVVRYRSTDEGASLSIDDAGAGIAVDAAAQAEAAGHFGLLNMAQRAEQVGAILDVRRWPSGGTHVALEWRPR